MSENKHHDDDDGGAELAPVRESGHRGQVAPIKQRSTKKGGRSRSAALYCTVEDAAAKLSLDSTALRARLRRAQRAEGDSIVADLGGGITAFKFGSSWRIRFPEP